MIGADQAWTVWEIDGKAVAESGARFRNDTTTVTVRREEGIERDFAQADHDFDARQQFEFLYEIGAAAKKFGYGGLVFRRRAAYRRRYIAIAKLETIVSVTGVRLIGKSGGM